MKIQHRFLMTGLWAAASLAHAQSSVRNRHGGKAFKVGNGLAVSPPGGTSTGADVGIRHNF